MAKLICSKCSKVLDPTELDKGRCPSCGLELNELYHFHNSDYYLKKKAPLVIQERKATGLEGLVKGLDSVVINTEPDRLKATAGELLNHTGLEFDSAYAEENSATCVLKKEGSADFVLKTRNGNPNPFKYYNRAPKAIHLPNTRLETFVFECSDLKKYVEIQKLRGVVFLHDEIFHTDNYSFIQTLPSIYTGNSIGLIQWHKNKGNYFVKGSTEMYWKPEKPNKPYLKNIKELDHTATRIRARARDSAIIEFLQLTNYHFDFAIYVKVFNSITSVARLTDGDFAMVFTSGIFPFISDADSGPTEKFVRNYGARVHHMAFNTDDIEEVYHSLKKDGMEYLIELVGSPDDGLKQTFTTASENTLLVNEYIHRYGDYDGFFTRSNVTALTGATGRQ